MARQRNLNPLWQVGAECDYFGKFDQAQKNPVPCKIVKMSEKLGHVTVEIKMHGPDAAPTPMKFRVGNNDYTYDRVDDNSVSRYSACLHIRTPEYIKKREDNAERVALLDTQRDAFQRIAKCNQRNVMFPADVVVAMVALAELMENN